MSKMENKKIQFKNLSVPLKTAIITTYIIGTLYLLIFLVGFIIGVTETI